MQRNLFTKQKQTHRHRKQTCGYQRGKGGGGIKQAFGISRYKLLFIKQINNKVLLYSTGNYIQYSCNNLIERQLLIEERKWKKGVHEEQVEDTLQIPQTVSSVQLPCLGAEYQALFQWKIKNKKYSSKITPLDFFIEFIEFPQL